MNSESKSFSVLQRIGRSFMLPIALLPIAGLFLGVGQSFTNPSMLQTYNLGWLFGEGTVLGAIFTVLSDVGNIIFANLPIIFAAGVALGMAQSEKATATLSALISFLVMHQTINACLKISGKLDEGADVLEGSITSVAGIESLQMGVFGGIIVGLGVAFLHNKFYKIKLPTVLSFFGGTRFIPIITTVAYTAVGVLLFFLWPFVQTGIYSLGDLVNRSGYAGTFIYGFIERILIPFGLHHVFYLPFWQTGLGGSAVIAGEIVYGAQNIFFAELAAGVDAFSVSATRFMSGKFAFMIFGLPGAALALYSTAKPNKRRIVGGLLLSAALTAMLTGITEPLEFTFLFVAPTLYLIHCVIAGASYMLMHMLNVGVGMTFSGGIIDLTLFGVIQGNDKTNWIRILPIGIIFFVLYFAVFKFLIEKRDYKTPGREDDEAETKLYTRADYNERKESRKGDRGTIVTDGDSMQREGVGDGTGSVANNRSKGAQTAELIIKALGGRGNFDEVDCCATRLRLTVHDPSKVNEAALRATGAAGVIVRGKGVQVIYGPQVSVIKSDIEDVLKQ